MRRRLHAWALPVVIAGIAWGATGAACGESRNPEVADSVATADSLRDAQIREDSIRAAREDSLTRYTSLTEADFRLVAEELGVEVAAMKAVVSIEAGAAMKGFWAPGVPVVNFDPSMYRLYGPKAPSKKGNKNAKVPEGLSGYALKEWRQLTNARHTNEQGADMGTFWGMFQIGGFNYRLCGCASVTEFVEKMSYSELEQLELFAHFIENTGMVKHLRAREWAKFARAYNGPSYARRGYHTRMANAYKKFKAQEG